MAALSVSAWPRDKVPVELKKAVIQDEREPGPVEFEQGDM